MKTLFEKIYWTCTIVNTILFAAGLVMTIAELNTMLGIIFMTPFMLQVILILLYFLVVEAILNYIWGFSIDLFPSFIKNEAERGGRKEEVEKMSVKKWAKQKEVEKMSMKKWAKQECKFACERENPDWDGKSFDYGCNCYQSALKAYKSLCDDKHSGFSFSLTRSILIRLLYRLPLTPIEDTEDNWSNITALNKDSWIAYQCTRMSSLFKYVDNKGNVTYHDVERAYCEEVTNPKNRFNGSACSIIDELFPITMPYYPKTTKRYKIVVDTFTAKGFESDNTAFNTRAVLYIVTPEKEKVEINRYYGEKDNRFVEITKDEYAKRLESRKEG